MVYIAYFTELILQICDYAQKRRIRRKNCKYALDKNFHCHFCFRRKAAKFCHPNDKKGNDDDDYNHGYDDYDEILTKLDHEYDNGYGFDDDDDDKMELGANDI